ncbi:hypothetical protein CYY_009700 [Polysphondylium violaceum]|uniref:Peptidyl-prolyl cis-trans isomerase n=1 Tax=Polysphondylium violaceum TaxID=133409 RepID=A0A8J4PT86_9MYCE|nr:hypothetical protein CYY_009700 [Polysphondylium violaceum]
MSVLIETTLGDIVIDLFTKECPSTTKNFLKLCKVKYYNGCLFYNVEKDFLVETGDPTNTGKSGQSIYGLLYGEEANHFQDEIKPSLRHTRIGTVAMANKGKNLNDSRFYITTKENIDYLNDKHTVFGQVEEGLDVLEKINSFFVDSSNKPLQNIRILHTIILDDPFPDPQGLEIPNQSPRFKKSEQDTLFEADEDLDKENKNKSKEEITEMIDEKAARSRSELLEMLGVLPTADIKPPENVLFVCKLNPATESEDLEIYFSQCGKVKSCEVIRDAQTNESLCYAFIEYSTKEECERAYLKMDNILFDERRIHVDFCQSVAKVKGRGDHFKNFLNRGKSNLRSTSTQHIPSGTKGYDFVFDDDHNRDHSSSSSSKKIKYDNEKKSDRDRRDDRDHRDYKKDDRYSNRDYKRDDRDRRDDRDDKHYSSRRNDDRDDRNYSSSNRDRRDDRNYSSNSSRDYRDKRDDRDDRNYSSSRRDDKNYNSSSSSRDYRDKRDDRDKR